MIKGIHGLFYTDQAEALRAFFRDQLGLPCQDAGGGWLIFRFAEGDLGCHPVDHPGAPPPNTAALSFYCDDLAETVAALRDRGVRFTQEIEDHGYGLVTHLEAPGGLLIQLYQPRY
jgi:predicted enzyme related to lactoylglutathione lyase